MTASVGSARHLPASAGAATPFVIPAIAAAATGMRLQLMVGITPALIIAVLLLPVWWPAVRGYRFARGLIFTGLAVAVLEHRVTETRLCLEHAREHAGQTLTRPEIPALRKGPRRTRAELDRERLPHRVARRGELQARVTAREQAGTVSTASNNWRHRQAAVDRELDDMRQDRRDRAEIRRLTSLINRTERS